MDHLVEPPFSPADRVVWKLTGDRYIRRALLPKLFHVLDLVFSRVYARSVVFETVVDGAVVYARDLAAYRVIWEPFTPVLRDRALAMVDAPNFLLGPGATTEAFPAGGTRVHLRFLSAKHDDLSAAPRAFFASVSPGIHVTPPATETRHVMGTPGAIPPDPTQTGLARGGAGTATSRKARGGAARSESIARGTGASETGACETSAFERESRAGPPDLTVTFPDWAIFKLYADLVAVKFQAAGPGASPAQPSGT